MNLFSIPPDAPFLDALAASWLKQGAAGDPLAVARGLILLPTRRAARALAEAFLRATDGRPLLLPRITALGALDEAPLALAGALDLPPPVAQPQRLAVLSRLILALEGRFGAPRALEAAWKLAADLAALMDEAERAEIDLAARLPDAVPGGLARHWEMTLDFLRIVTRAWPDWLAENGLMNPAARQVRLLDAQARAWRDAPPDHPVVVAGATGGIPAVARLLRVVAALPQGRVALPGLDAALPDVAWEALDDAHPQAGLQRLLTGLGAARGDVRPWPAAPSAVPAGRPALLSRALLPAAALATWREEVAAETHGLFRLYPADAQEEALAIALVLRDALERPGARAALVTPDRALAGRVAAELLRFGIVADDSAGEKLADTPPAVLLRLLAGALGAGFAPVPLLALLKHPLVACGLAPAAARGAARALERACLRGPRPAPGLNGIRRTLDQAADVDPAVPDLLVRFEVALHPLLRTTNPPAAPAALLAALIAAAEGLAATDTTPGPARLWAAEEGEALAAHLAQTGAALDGLPESIAASPAGLIDALLEGPVVRTRRSLRGRGGAEHPRVFIWGLLEARLQSAEVMVLGGLVEGVWPPATDPGPWLSRQMRAAVGLPAAEERIGQAAHDFVAAACAAPVVVLSAPRRRDGAPAVPARWLVRLDALLAGQGQALPAHPAVHWARALDQPEGPPDPARPPRPRPPVALRPRRLRVTEIETWLADPYAIYARHVLRLDELAGLDERTDAADYGVLVHRAIHRFLETAWPGLPDDAPARLRAAMDGELLRAALRPALAAWWRPRLYRIADWVAAEEARRRAATPLAALGMEVAGEWRFDAPAGPFTLRGRADRIERRADGNIAILDYKTGTPPTDGAVESGSAPQLPLEAGMAELGHFGEAYQGPVRELTYWRLTGGAEPGVPRPLFGDDGDRVASIADTARDRLVHLVSRFDDPAQPYLSRPHPGRAARATAYAQLARLAEWDAAGEGE